MARNITLTLGPGLGSNLGPNFNLTANSGVVTPSTATRTELLAGKIVSVDDIASQATITSIGTCTNAISQTIICGTTSTTSSTTSSSTTTTPIICDEYFNNNSTAATGLNYTTCSGTEVSNGTLDSNQSVCVQRSTMSGGDSGSLMILSEC